MGLVSHIEKLFLFRRFPLILWVSRKSVQQKIFADNSGFQVEFGMKSRPPRTSMRSFWAKGAGTACGSIEVMVWNVAVDVGV